MPAPSAGRNAHDGARRRDGGNPPPRSTDERIRDFRRRAGGSAAVLGVLSVVNVLTTPFFPWVVFPAVGFSISLAHRLGGLWADGVPLREVFGAKSRGTSKRRTQPLAALPGEVLPRAAVNADRTRREMQELVDGLSPPDRQMIPDVMPTVDRLVERIRLLSVTITRLDSAVDPGAAAALDARIARAEESGDSGGTLALLRRQRESLQDLLARRATLRAQIDSASLVLENLRLQLVKLRSAGVQSAMENVTSATQEARALAREIGHVLDAASEVRALGGRRREEG